MKFTVKPIDAATHLAFINGRDPVSFLQTPAWAAVKSQWRGESLGWFDADNELRGAGLVLYRKVPRLNRYLAYLPEGPAIDWSAATLSHWLDPLAVHVKSQRTFAIRLGPPVVARRWQASTIKAAIADPALTELDDVPADASDPDALATRDALRAGGWRKVATEGGFAAGQPQYNFWLPLTDVDGAPRTPHDLLAGMNQLWRRNIRKAENSGVVVRLGDRSDLATFHRVYRETAERDHFTPRPLGYFEQMWDALRGEDPQRLRLYLAEHDGDVVAATTLVRVGRHAWYSYGASTAYKRDVRGSNAIQWRMITDAVQAGASVYDMRGITDTVRNDDPHIGLLQFKVGTGGEAVEYLGEWDLPLNRLLYSAFTAAMRIRR